VKGKCRNRESGDGWEERKIGRWDPSGDTYMKAASRRCVLKKWGTRFEQERNVRNEGGQKASLELRSISKPKVSASKSKRQMFADFGRFPQNLSTSRRQSQTSACPTFTGGESSSAMPLRKGLSRFSKQTKELENV
jgi:hypothetical protein